jgi:hypothetical protein
VQQKGKTVHGSRKATSAAGLSDNASVNKNLSRRTVSLPGHGLEVAKGSTYAKEKPQNQAIE